MESLCSQRPLFHSEADFQFAFAWASKTLYPHVEIRLETHPDPSVRLDLQIDDAENGETVAIELKYLTRSWVSPESQDGERFALKNHGAQDLRRYDVVKDIHRVEHFIADRPTWRGFGIVLTNDPAYWEPPTSLPTSLDAAFRIHDGMTLPRYMAWSSITASAKGREDALELTADYALTWVDYSTLDSSRGGSFRSLVVPIRQLEIKPDRLAHPRSGRPEHEPRD